MTMSDCVVSGIINLLNQKVVHWSLTKLKNIDTATYGSEAMFSRQATEKIMDLRTHLE
jgi:hypothetical protein